MKTLSITATPYAVQYGTLNVPDDLSEKEYKDYVNKHFDEIKFGETELDYVGTDLEINES